MRPTDMGRLTNSAKRYISYLEGRIDVLSEDIARRNREMSGDETTWAVPIGCPGGDRDVVLTDDHIVHFAPGGGQPGSSVDRTPPAHRAGTIRVRRLVDTDDGSACIEVSSDGPLCLYPRAQNVVQIDARMPWKAGR